MSSSQYRVWKEWHCGKGRYRVECGGDRLVGYVASERGAELLIEADRVEEKMYSAPLVSRSKPTMFKGVSID